MRFLKAADHRRMPWKNGGGETIEIAVHPPGADLASFEWRISMATVASDGPFSRFEGVDRTLSILGGNGMDLEIEGRGRHALSVGSDPLSFPADAPTSAFLHDGTITDLNLMTRRGVCRHRVVPLVPKDGMPVPLDARWRFVIASAPCRIEIEGAVVDAVAGDTIVLEDADEALSVSSSMPVPAYFVAIWPGA